MGISRLQACTSKSNILHDRWVWLVNEFFRVIMFQLGKRAVALFQLRLLTSVPGIAQAPFFRTDRGVGTVLPSMIVTSHDHPYKSQPLCLIGRVPFLKGQKSQGKAQVDFDTASRASMGELSPPGIPHSRSQPSFWGRCRRHIQDIHARYCFVDAAIQKDNLDWIVL